MFYNRVFISILHMRYIQILKTGMESNLWGCAKNIIFKVGGAHLNQKFLNDNLTLISLMKSAKPFGDNNYCKKTKSLIFKANFVCLNNWTDSTFFSSNY